MPAWVIVLIVLAVVAALMVATCLGGLFYLGTSGLETFVQTGNQVTRSVKEDLAEMEVLGPGETVRFFYSDAVTDPRKGSYVLTDQRLVLFSEDWDPPLEAIAFGDITVVDGEWSDNWLTDSMIYIELENGDAYAFPLSMENDGDHRFVRALLDASPNAQGSSEP